MDAISRIATRFRWEALTPIAALLVAVSCIGSTGAWLGAVARIPFVAGIDRYLPPVFGRMHPRWGSPVAALVTQASIAAAFIFLGQGGRVWAVRTTCSSARPSSSRWCRSSFSSRRQSSCEARAPPAGVTVPGGSVTICAAAIIGLITTLVAMIFAGFPAADDPNKTLAVVKVIGLTLLVLAGGLAIYAQGRRKVLQNKD